MSWSTRLRARRVLLARAERSVRYWSSRAGYDHGRQMLEAAKARRALRRRQVADAQTHLGISTLSNAGLALIAGFEGFRSAPYRDPVGVWTIGYGETRGVGPGTKPWTRAHALQQLEQRANRDYLGPVLAACKGAGLVITQHEADALTSLVYNCGPGILGPTHTMGSAIHSRNRQRIANAFLAYQFAGGRVLPGLTRRRQAERALFLK